MNPSQLIFIAKFVLFSELSANDETFNGQMFESSHLICLKALFRKQLLSGVSISFQNVKFYIFCFIQTFYLKKIQIDTLEQRNKILFFDVNNLIITHLYYNYLAHFNSKIDMQFAQDQIKQFLSESPNEQNLEQFLHNFKVTMKLEPTKMLHQIDLKQQKQPVLVFSQLMVQDIRDKQYFYPMFVKKPLKPDSQFWFVKYGGQYFKPQHQKLINQMVQSDQYVKVIQDRQVVNCCSLKYENYWIKQLKGQKNQSQVKNLRLVLDSNVQCKLGITLNAICYWDPITESLYHLQDISQKLAMQINIDSWNRIIQEQKHNNYVNLIALKQKIMCLFSKFCSSRYAHFLLFTLISNQSLFISGENIQPIINQLVPRTFSLKLKAPFKSSLFPYKNHQGVLIQTPMQMSNESTFVFLDFSEISEKQQIKIENEEIDNLKALKLFVQDGKTIYRWEIGQSQIPHKHVGIIVKASKIVIPHFALKDQKIINVQQTAQLLKQMPEDEKRRLRAYLALAKTYDPKLDSEQSQKIKKSLEQEKDIPKGVLDLKQTMRISRIIAMSEGRNSITHEDYKKARQLIFMEFLNEKSKMQNGQLDQKSEETVK